MFKVHVVPITFFYKFGLKILIWEICPGLLDINCYLALYKKGY